jgi:predicted dehydrogenase
MKTAVRIGVIGAGRAGMIHARNFVGSIPDAVLTSMADPSEEALRNAEKEIGSIEVFSDYRQLLEKGSVDAVIVVTPTNLHMDVVQYAAAQGKHVLCEKPMAINVDECRQMIAACDSAGTKLQIGFMRRFDKGFRYAKEQIEAGAIGEVVLVKSLTHGPSKPQPWMLDIEKSNGPLAEVSSHDIDTLRWFADSDISEVYAIAGNYRSRFAAEEYPRFYDNVIVASRFSDGKQGLIEGAVHVKYGYDARAEILGTEGVLFVGGLSSNRVQVVTQKRGVASPVVESWRSLFLDAYRAEDRSFIECIRNDTTPEVTGYDGMQAVEVVNAGNRSIETGLPVTISVNNGEVKP